jgi:tol-pal system protein YbgF
VQAAATTGAGGVNAAGQFVLQTDAQGRPLAADPNAAAAPPPETKPAGPAPAPKAAPAGATPAASQLALNTPTDVRLPDGSAKLQYEYAFEFLKRNDYGRAEVALRDFLKRHGKDPLAGNAQYWLGETFYVRGDYQQAAVEFMAGYQQYPKTVKGPDNLLKLGMALSKLNQTQGACTALGRINKDYPDAPDTILKSAGAERSKLKCK